jgi:hypothetical protein
MANLTPSQLYDLARGAGLSPAAAVTAAAVALGESGGNPAAVGDVGIQTSKWGPSVGLWQIRSLKADQGTGRTRDASKLTDPAFNARAMAEVSGTGSNWRPWSVFTSGKYRQYLDSVTTAANQPRSPRADNASGSGHADTNSGIPVIGGAIDAAEKLNPLAAFSSWQSDVTGIAVKLTVTAAALALVVFGVKSAAGGDE